LAIAARGGGFDIMIGRCFTMTNVNTVLGPIAPTPEKRFGKRLRRR
jgi:hypothetical protein